jgi:GH15 family glucan-1,4-alpha-glucosidase
MKTKVHIGQLTSARKGARNTGLIEDYGLIGNLRTAALVSREGSIDWLCLPHFDSPACFASLLGTEDHGRWQLRPVGRFKTRRRYRPGTAVLETDFETFDGIVRLTDCMIPETERADLVRCLEGLEGEVKMRMDLRIRLDYGSHQPSVRYGKNSIVAVGGPDMLHVYAPVPFYGNNERTRSEFKIRRGQHLNFVMNWHPSHEKEPPALKNPETVVRNATRWWAGWSKRSTYKGDWHEAMERSLITLKCLTFHPTGGIVAAPTTSLPEKLGGVRNWDYRFCWIRDATLTLNAFMGSGYLEEARAWREWLLRAVAGQPEGVRIMYGLFGERQLPELELPWLPGYEGSAPVRIGNRASTQHQLDIFGELMDSLHQAREGALEHKEESWGLQKALLQHLEAIWDQPDEGIWEVRGPKRHFTHSKVMAWVAFDRGVQAVERHGRSGPVRRWRALRDAIHDDVCKRGIYKKTGGFAQYYGANQTDASLLMIPLVGFLPANDPRMEATIRWIQKDLTSDGFVERYSTSKRYVDGLPPGEGTFLACSFWMVENLALLGRREEAVTLFERLLSIRNDLGLLAEEYEPRLGRALGNFPQAFSHLALVSAARRLSQARIH